MKKLDEKEWKPIRLEDEFDCTKGVYLPTATVTDGDIPFVTAKAGNNGVSRFIGNKTLFNGNKITIEKIKLSSYYQRSPFYCSHDVSVILNENLNEHNAQFISEMIMRNGSKYSYGRQAQLNVVKREQVMLPVTDSGEPDYDYMAQYASEMMRGMLMLYKNYIDRQLSRLEYKDIPELNEKEWSEFRLGDLFEVRRPKARNKDDYEVGDIPFVASGAMNNGVMKYCQVKSEEKLDRENCITVSPVDGSSFYQPMDFLGRGGAGSSIIILRNDDLNLFRGEFMARMIKQTCSKYNYGHMGNKDSIKREQIMFPVDDAGNPDYNYMEQYSKNMLLRKYHQYLDFLTHLQS